MKAAFLVSSLTLALSAYSASAATSQYSPTQLAAPAVSAEAQNQQKIDAAATQRDPRFQARYGNVRRAQQAAPAQVAAPAKPGAVVVPPAAAVVPQGPQQDSRFQARYGNVRGGLRAAPAAAPTATAAHRGVAAAVAAPVVPVRREDPGLEDRIISFQRQNAISGNRTSQYDLGMRYLKGDGLEQDLKQARHWLELSAKNGYSRAKKQLAHMPAETKTKAKSEESAEKDSTAKEPASTAVDKQKADATAEALSKK